MTIQEYIYRRLCNAGMTPEGACGVLGNLQGESRFIANNVEDGRGWTDAQYTVSVDNGTYPKNKFVNDGIGYGYAQWTHYSRKALFYEYFKEKNVSIADSDTQIEFLIWEMKNFFSIQWNLCCNSQDLYACTWELLDKWENPAEKERAINVRYGYAKNWYDKFSSLTLSEVKMDEGGSDGTGIKQETKLYDQNSAIETVLNLARNEIGYHEKASNSNLYDKAANSGSGNYTKYAKELDSMTDWYNGAKNGYAWCDIFYDWLFYKCFGTQLGRQMICQPTHSAGAGCLYSAQYYKSAGRFVTSNPQPGDQIFFTYNPGEYSHTGIVEKVENGTITTIEGNTSDQVARKTYPIYFSVIAGYGRPKWDLAENTPVTSSPVDFVNGDITDRYAMLRKGSIGEDVRKIQEQLIRLGYGLGPDGADGEFGTNTEKAVIAFQMSNGLEIDGVVGTETRKKLNELIAEQDKLLKQQTDAGKASGEIGTGVSGTDGPTGSTGDDPENPKIPKNRVFLPEIKMDDETDPVYVKLAQTALACWGYSIIVSGIFGKEMDQKIRDFQENKGLDTDGVIGPDTWKKLLDFLVKP